MIDILKRFFNSNEDTPPSAIDQEQETNVAVCALFLEMGRIDRPFSDQELEHVLTIIIEKFDLSRELAEALIHEADHELENSVDLWQFARVINENYSNERKLKIIERLWEVAYVDGKMESHERYLMSKLSKLLRISHKQLISIKLSVSRNR